MEKTNLDYSLKNIPIPSTSSYRLKLIEKIESVIKRMRWKAQFFMKEEEENEGPKKENYGFKTRKCPKQCIELDNFEKDLLDTVKNIKFRKITDTFQAQLKNDVKKIKESPNILTFADKSSNIYDLKPEDYEKFLQENITKQYKKASTKNVHEINCEAKIIAEKLQLDDRIECLAKSQAFITMKDHKENFRTKPTCRLLNPTKSELGKISKIIVEDINKQLRNILKLNQWKNTGAVIEWFSNIENKESCAFIQLDIKDFYPSITERILDNAISFAKDHIHISDHNINIIKHCRKSLLFHNDSHWIKKNTESNFDVTMSLKSPLSR